MKRYLILTGLALGTLLYSSEEPPVDVIRGDISSNHIDIDGDTLYAEALWFALSVNYLSGGIRIDYPFGSGIEVPPIISITPVYTGNALEQITPIIVENTTTGITIVVAITSILGLIREALTDEVALHIIGIIPNENTQILPIASPALGLGSFDFGGI